MGSESTYPSALHKLFHKLKTHHLTSALDASQSLCRICFCFTLNLQSKKETALGSEQVSNTTDFAFRLTTQEFTNLISQDAISRSHGGRRTLPIAFTEHGAIMLASVLNSEIAIQASIRVVRAFVRLREMVAANAQLASKLTELERRLDSHDQAIVDLFATLKRLLEPPEPPKKREIGFHVREKAAQYRVRRRSKINDRISRIS